MNRMNALLRSAAAAFGLALAAAGAAASETAATAAEAQQRLTAIVDLVKAKGPAKAAEEIMGSGDPLKCKYKDMTCLLVNADTKFVVNTAQTSLMGQSLPPDLTDIDGVPIVANQFGPAKAGKTKWEAKFKFTKPGTKMIVPRWSFCETAGSGYIACTVVSQQ